MKFSISIQTLLANYGRFMDGELKHTQFPEKQFHSPYICYQLKNHFLPEISDENPPHTYENFVIANGIQGVSNFHASMAITEQFRTQFAELCGVSVNADYMAMENWFDDENTPFFKQDCEPAAEYRFRVLKFAYSINPNFVFNFTIGEWLS